MKKWNKIYMDIETLFKITILIATILSFYIFLSVLIFKNEKYKKIYSNWQFPMLFAIALDVWFVYI